MGSPCHGIECGPNAECRHEVRPIGDEDATMPGATICVCRDGHTGDPDDLERGCAIDMRKDERPGGETAALPSSASDSTLLAVDDIEKNPPAAQQPSTQTLSKEEKCRYGLSCFQWLFIKPLIISSVTLCVTWFGRAKNETYGVGEEWHDGCELKCVCNDKVEIVCQERCKVSQCTSRSGSDMGLLR